MRVLVELQLLDCLCSLQSVIFQIINSFKGAFCGCAILCTVFAVWPCYLLSTVVSYLGSQMEAEKYG